MAIQVRQCIVTQSCYFTSLVLARIVPVSTASQLADSLRTGVTLSTCVESLSEC